MEHMGQDALGCLGHEPLLLPAPLISEPLWIAGRCQRLCRGLREPLAGVRGLGCVAVSAQLSARRISTPFSPWQQQPNNSDSAVQGRSLCAPGSC